MAWEEITPRRGMRTDSGSSVTVAWRRSGTGKQSGLMIVCSKMLTAELGWQPKSRISVARNRIAGKLRLQPVEAGGFSVMILKGLITHKVLLGGVESEKRSAEQVPFEIHLGALILTLPDWAAPERRGMAGAEEARRRAMEKTEEPRQTATAPAAKAPYVGITARMPDPAIGRRVG